MKYFAKQTNRESIIVGIKTTFFDTQGVSMDFVSVDVETANSDMASICQIGIAIFKGGNLIDTWETLVDPGDYFDEINISIHGITERDVKGAPKFSEVTRKINHYFKDGVVVSHGSFDRTSLFKAFERCGESLLFGSWLDTTRVARRTWPQFARKGFGLANVSETIGFEFKHHNALEDAKAAGAVLIEAIKLTGISLDEWPKRVSQPIDPSSSSVGSSINRDGDPDGDLFGEVLVFTGSLSMVRSQAADIAAKMGCSVASGVTKKTTLLVVGDQDVDKLSGKTKSSKHLKAETLIAKGQMIRILKESDFIAMIN